MLRSEINKVIDSRGESSAEVVCETNFDPSPYDINCEKIYISKGFGPNDFSVSGSTLRVKGSLTALKNLSDNFPEGVGKYEGTVQYHHHYDVYSFPEYVSSDSPEVVLSLVQ